MIQGIISLPGGGRVLVGEEVIGSDDMFTSIGSMDGMDGGDMGTETGVKDPILSSIPFVAGTIGASLVVGIVLGILLGKKRIKKGFDYEN
ncbi:MAG: hypothetical protein K2O71_03270 [Lachnospiraceae bacterium]|nr:hypothetical protein [Lachnospiraceae bacterium]